MLLIQKANLQSCCRCWSCWINCLHVTWSVTSYNKTKTNRIASNLKKHEKKESIHVKASSLEVFRKLKKNTYSNVFPIIRTFFIHQFGYRNFTKNNYKKKTINKIHLKLCYTLFWFTRKDLELNKPGFRWGMISSLLSFISKFFAICGSTISSFCPKLL